MIEVVSGDLFEAKAEAYVNAVNCAGVGGRGVALQFKNLYPDYFRTYREACKLKKLHPGEVLSYDAGFKYEHNPRYIISFATKGNWFENSHISWVEAGLVDLVEETHSRGISTIALPALGCGNGGLEWEKVRKLVVNAFAPSKRVTALLYEPTSSW